MELGPIAKELIICDDGAWDESPQVIRAQSQAADGLLQVHTSPVNLGKGAAVRLGFHYATGDILIIQDADLELDPAAHRQIIGPIVAGEADEASVSICENLCPKCFFRTGMNTDLHRSKNICVRLRKSVSERLSPMSAEQIDLTDQIIAAAGRGICAHGNIFRQIAAAVGAARTETEVVTKC